MTDAERKAFWRGFRRGYVKAHVITVPLYLAFVLWMVLR